MFVSIVIVILLLIRLSHSTNITTTSSAACVLYNEDGSIRPYRVVISVDKRLLEVFLNWLIFYAECCHNNFKHLDIICLDTTIQKEIELLGLRCHAKSFFIKGNSDEVTTKGTLWTHKKTKDASNVQSVDKLGALWSFRVRVIIEYVSSNVDVILSDADALWLKDPLVDINKFISTADIIASRAIYPHNLFKKWNSTICMGFIYMKTVTFVEEFFKKVGNIVQNDNYPDDQKTMNELLDINNVTWPKMALDRNDVDLGKIIWSGTNTSHVIALLPHDKFIRKCHDQTMARGSSLDARLQTVNNLANTRVAHCRTTKGQGRMKANTLKVYKLWKLKHGWKLSLEKFLRKKFNKKGKRYIEHMMNALKT